MGRPSGPKTRCGGRWTEAKFNTFIRNNLRGGSRKWGPIQDVKREANVRRGFYLCNGCKQEVPHTTKQGRRRIQNVFVDHIEPIVDPVKGFTGFDDFIDRLFCEKDNLQVLCADCHTKKSLAERAEHAKRREKEKQE